MAQLGRAGEVRLALGLLELDARLVEALGQLAVAGGALLLGLPLRLHRGVLLREVGEPSVEATIAILRGLKERYEAHHDVRITDAALIAAATLSDRYIADRFLPDKAIDLMDEAASRIRMEVESKPEEIENLDRRIIQPKIDR